MKRLQEFNQSDLNEQEQETHIQMDVQSRHFRLHYQKLNTSKLINLCDRYLFRGAEIH